MYPLQTVETIRVESVEEAEDLNAQLKRDAEIQHYELNSFSYTKKCIKKTGEEYVVVKVVKLFEDEKDPYNELETIEYRTHPVDTANAFADDDNEEVAPW